jgi:hypothetical protein
MEQEDRGKETRAQEPDPVKELEERRIVDAEDAFLICALGVAAVIVSGLAWWVSGLGTIAVMRLLQP